MKTYVKTPTEQSLDYAINWRSRNVIAVDETIVNSVWSVTAGLTVVAQSSTATSTAIWVSGGTTGSRYDLTNTITTSAGRVFSRTFRIRVVAAISGD